jgi:asparagine synthase (glutamine-hydrolysing)
MCGICGIAGPDGGGPAAVEAVADMADALRHRGPDGTGRWTDADAGISFGHRRLAIVELSASGAQPMVSHSGRYVLVFNGEIYNHQALRSVLPPVAWRGQADTETLVAAIEAWGLEETLRRVAGMFAFALWDRARRVLSLARDRFGEKPLYYGWQGRTLLFGSELKALRRHPAFEGVPDATGLALFLRFGHVPAPYSAYAGIRKLPAGTWLDITAPWTPGLLPEPRPYWSLDAAARDAAADPWSGGLEPAVETLERVLEASVARQMVADVPLGAFLSGGIDSSIVVALMQRQASRQVQTFSLGFRETEYDEAPFARAVARHLGTDHTELYVTEADARRLVPGLSAVFDEPFGDSSAVPTMLLSALTRRHVSVGLTGDGGDELFIGYRRYRRSARIVRLFSRWPRSVRRPLGRALGAGLRMAGALVDAVPARWQPAQWLAKAERTSAILAAPAALHAYDALTAHAPVEAGPSAYALWPETWYGQRLEPFPERALATADLARSLPDDMLVKVDRASMAYGFETRAPFLDEAVAQLALRLPRSHVLDDRHGKLILRRLLERHVPRALFDRPKQGFGAPIETWLRGPLRAWAEDLIATARRSGDPLLQPAVLERKFREFLSGSGAWQAEVWDRLMLVSWYAAAGDSAGVRR